MRRPFAVTILSWLFIAAGAVGLVYHAVGFRAGDPLADVILVLVVRALAVLGGVFALRGANWARWLLVAWMAYHLALGFGHSTSEIASHAILLLVTAIVYFRAPGSTWFRRGWVSGV